MGLSIWHLLVVLAIALVIFGTKKLRNFGGDVGGAIKNFKDAVRSEEEQKAETEKKSTARVEKRPARVIDAKTAKPRKKKV